MLKKTPARNTGTGVYNIVAKLIRVGFFEIISAVLFLELFDPPCGIDEFLFTGVERVAGGANIHADVLAKRRAGSKCVPAGAGYGNVFVFGMYLCLHVFFTSTLNQIKDYTDIRV